MDFEIPDELHDIVDAARKFARSELAEAEVDIDRIQNPAEAFTSDTHRKVTKLLAELGFTKLTLPEEVGGLGLGPLARHLVEYELAIGGAGLTSQWLLTPLAATLIANWGLAERHPVYHDYLEAYIDDTEGIHSGAWSITEPDTGSDIFSFGDPGIRFRARARASAGGSGYIINGAKSSWCSNGWLADMLCVMVAVDTGNGMDGTGTFLIPADWPGVQKGKPISKVGLRALNQTDLSFDDVEVPEEFLIAPPGPVYRQLFDAFVTNGNTAVGNIALGVAQAAYEVGLAYAKERRQAGRRIIEHQLVARRLFDAYRRIEASKLLIRRSLLLLAQGEVRPEVAFAARVQACETAAKVTDDMVFIHGGNGITTEYPVAKLWRDTRPLQIMDGTLDRVALKGAALL